ncbi:MAG: DUF1134 domain-containing protein [Hyphomicrobiaceae bacterium]
MFRLRFAALIGCLTLSFGAPAMAQTAGKACSQADLAAVISDMSLKLRKANVDSQTRLRARLREFAKLKGWSESETEEKGLDLLEDDETKVQDETASHLLGQIDKLGQSNDAAPSCKQIDELKAVAAQLLEVTSAKAAHVSAKLDGELRNARPTIASPSAIPPSAEPKRVAPATETAIPPTKTPVKPSWETAVRPSDAYVPPPLAPAAPAPVSANAAELQFSVDDIRAAGRGFFGSISAELAAVIEYMFKSYGRPTGYILGTEGGAALLAGLRYGDGMFVTKFAGERKIYWQGPSVGYDFGLTGSRTMILIYGLTNPDEMLQRFGGVDGSAYLVGGAGVTIMKNGPIILAPIRTGLGLRLGANIGYLRFTAKPRFNPL